MPKEVSNSARRIATLLVLLTIGSVSLVLWDRASPYWPAGSWTVTSRSQPPTSGSDGMAVTSRAQQPVAVEVAPGEEFVEVPQKGQTPSSVTSIPGCQTSGDDTAASSSTSRDTFKTPASIRLNEIHTQSLTCVAHVNVLVPKRFVMGPASPGDRLHVRIVARTAAGDVRTSCDDLFEVRLEGPALHVPPVTCDHVTGVYSANMFLVETGTYSLTVRFVETIQYVVPRVCFERASPNGYVLGRGRAPRAKILVREKSLEEAHMAGPKDTPTTPRGEDGAKPRSLDVRFEPESDPRRRPRQGTRPSEGGASPSRTRSRIRSEGRARGEVPHEVEALDSHPAASRLNPSSQSQGRRRSLSKSLPPRLEVEPLSTLDSGSGSGSDSDDASLCRPHEFFRGRWVLSPQAAPYPTGRSYRYEWRTNGRCDWPAYWSLERLKRVVSGRWILFIGDSTTQEAASTFLQLLLESPFNSSWNWLKPHYDGRPDARIYDAHLPNGTRITFLWNANEDATVNIGYGAAAMRSSGFQTSLRRLLGPTGRPDAVVLNSGLHDLYSMDSVSSFERYEEDIRAGMKMVAAITDLPIWRHTSPKRHNFECGASYKGLSGQASVHKLNQVAERVASEHNFTVVDQTQFSLAWYDAGKRHHSWQTQPCDLFTLSFFNLFHERWRDAR